MPRDYFDEMIELSTAPRSDSLSRGKSKLYAAPAIDHTHDKQQSFYLLPKTIKELWLKRGQLTLTYELTTNGHIDFNNRNGDSDFKGNRSFERSLYNLMNLANRPSSAENALYPLNESTYCAGRILEMTQAGKNITVSIRTANRKIPTSLIQQSTYKTIDLISIPESINFGVSKKPFSDKVGSRKKPQNRKPIPKFEKAKINKKIPIKTMRQKTLEESTTKKLKTYRQKPKNKAMTPTYKDSQQAEVTKNRIINEKKKNNLNNPLFKRHYIGKSQVN